MNTTQQTRTAKDVTPEEIDASKQHDDPFQVRLNAENLDFLPQSEELSALVERARTLTREKWRELLAAHRDRDPEDENFSWTPRDAIREAVQGLVCRDTIGLGNFTQEEYDYYTGPWRKLVGQIHPDDPRLP